MSGMAFALPISVLQAVYSELSKHGKLRKRYLGVDARQQAKRSKKTLDDFATGVLIGRVTAKSPAAKAGLKVGDLIVSIADNPILDINALEMELYSHAVGTTLSLTIMRNGRKHALSMRVSAQ
jgi:S1-C subfamily serine protease